MQFPESFDTIIYRNFNSDLRNHTDVELRNHYNIHGKNEGRKCSAISSRDNLKTYISKIANINCLEIGPFDSPVLSGRNVKYFDVLSQEQLRNRAIKINRVSNLNNIPYIDYVNEIGDLSIINEKFDIVLSCHSIEHQINLIKHLIDVSKLLQSGGCYVIICPDKRYCFDHFINETTIADVINNNTDAKKHSIKSVIEHRALVCHNDSVRHWNNDHGYPNYYNNKNLILNAVDEYNKTEDYIDVHSMQFTPASFENIINTLNAIHYLDLYVDKVYNTQRNSLEFFAILRKP